MAKWKGTAVPNTGTVEKVYFNTNLTDEEIETLCSNLTLNLDGIMEGILLTSDANTSISIVNLELMGMGVGYTICDADMSYFYYISPKSASVEGIPFVGWNADFNGVLEVNSEVRSVSLGDGVTLIGTQNDLISSLFSITPFQKTTLKQLMVDIGDSIRFKQENDKKIIPYDFPEEIRAIEGGLDTSDATATSEDILNGKIAYNAEGQVVGTMTNNGEVNLTIDGINSESVELPKGYIDGGSVSLTDDIPNEVNSQTTLIENIKTALNGKMTKPDDMLQARVDATNSCYYLFNQYSGDNVDFIKNLDTSNVGNMGSMFGSCRNLTTIPLLDTSNVTDMSYMFVSCSKLTTIPKLNTSNVTDMRGMFTTCSKLTTLPLLDTNKVTDMANMFQNCTMLASIPQLNTSKVNNMSWMFVSCPKLITIPELNVSSVTNMSNTFKGCTSLKSILMTGMKVSFDISASTKFEQSDLVTILNNLATVTSTQTLTMGSTNLAKLTDEDKAIATNKGWTLA